MFRRKTPSPSDPVDDDATLYDDEESGKGRPTPKRREAEAARKQRLHPPRGRKEASRQTRQRRYDERKKMQQALKTGEERHLPPRDQGPVRRFVRNFVDARWNAAEFLLPLLVLILALGFIPGAASVVVTIWMATILFTVVDTIWLFVRLKRELGRRFEPAERRGAVAYGILRSTQLRRIRLPKPQVSRGTKLPEHP